MKIRTREQWSPGSFGAFSGIPADEYHKEEHGLSRSMALEILQHSPAHMRHKTDNPEPPTPFMEFGTLVHCAVLEPDALANAYYVRPSTYPGKDGPMPWHGGSNWCKHWLSDHQDRPVITNAQELMLAGCVQAIRSNSKLWNCIQHGVAEVSVFSKSNDTKIKCRPDLIAVLPQGGLFVLDIKKTQDASYDAFKRRIRSYEYDFQEAWYRYVLDVDVDEFVFVAVEESPPHGVGLFRIDSANVRERQKDVHLAIDLYQQAKDDDHWRSYPSDIQTVGWYQSSPVVL